LGIIFWISVYLVSWWIVLFAILPIGIRSHADEGTEARPGEDPGAPVNPNLLRKFRTTTWVTAIVVAVIWVIVRFELISLPVLPQG